MQAPDCQAKNAHSESRSSSRPEFQSWLRYRRGGVRPLVGGDRDQGEEATCLPSRRRREGGFEPSFPRKEKALLRDRPFELSGTGAPERSALCGSADITQAILDGRQPPDLTAEKLLEHSRLPLAWHDQRTVLGFA